MAITDFAASTIERLRYEAKRKGLQFQEILQLFMQEEFLRKLEKSQYREKFILKGGMFLYTLSNFEGRATIDIDFLMKNISNDIRNVERIVEEIIKIESLDYVSMEIINKKQITLEKEYPGVCIKLIGHIKNIRIPFSIDFGLNDIIIDGPKERIIPTQLSDFYKPSIYTYSIESTIAEKFDAMLSRMERSSRMKDYFDIYYLSSRYDFEGTILKEAIYSTLTHRKTKYRDDSIKRIVSFIDDKDFCLKYKSFNPGPILEKPNLDLALNRIEVFIGPIFNSIIENNDYNLKWNHLKCCWE